MKSSRSRSPPTPFISRTRGPRLGTPFCTGQGGWGESWLHLCNKYRAPVFSWNSHGSGPLGSCEYGCKLFHAALFPHPYKESVRVHREFSPTRQNGVAIPAGCRSNRSYTGSHRQRTHAMGYTHTLRDLEEEGVYGVKLPIGFGKTSPMHPSSLALTGPLKACFEQPSSAHPLIRHEASGVFRFEHESDRLIMQTVNPGLTSILNRNRLDSFSCGVPEREPWDQKGDV
ncbi:hypothetical protein VNO77_08153 [Canavalia gladiata]|uniref:Uncharacterized protein n=1 Tax=Canavalia gladiata TaxID=3824 RepID=A0AAN9M907_CANGL